jgi:hypothetical protein
VYCQQRRHLARSAGAIAIEVEDGSAQIPLSSVNGRVKRQADGGNHPPSNLTSYFHADSVDIWPDASVNLTFETMSSFGNKEAAGRARSKISRRSNHKQYAPRTAYHKCAKFLRRRQ